MCGKRRALQGVVMVSVLALFLCAFSAGICGRAEAKSVNAEQQGSCQPDADIVFSYVDIFETYYEEAAEAGGSFAEECTLEEFMEGYYASGMRIDEYTEAVVSDGPVCVSSSSGDMDGGGTSGEDAYYILKESQNPDKDTTPASDFAQQPVYGTFDYSVIWEGDIVYETNTSFSDIGHDALVYDTEKDFEYGTYLQTVEAVAGGVQYGYLDDSRMVDFSVKILRVAGVSDTVVYDVREFCLEQLGKPYSLFTSDTDRDAESWYCSLLIYAAYLDAGIEIADYALFITPAAIYGHENTYEIVSASFLGLGISGKSGSKWSVVITNTSGSDITAYYNTKMCFKSDAKEWDGLDDEASVSIGALADCEVTISENFFATCIVASCIVSGYRLITYADNLDSSDCSLTCYYALTNA